MNRLSASEQPSDPWKAIVRDALLPERSPRGGDMPGMVLRHPAEDLNSFIARVLVETQEQVYVQLEAASMKIVEATERRKAELEERWAEEDRRTEAKWKEWDQKFERMLRQLEVDLREALQKMMV